MIFKEKMKKAIIGILSVLTIVSLQIAAQAQRKEIYSLDKTISLPGNGGYDYLSIDKINNRLYVSHGTSVNVIDLATEKVVGSIDNMQGVHGIAVANEFNKGFISDGKANSVIVFDLKTLKTIQTISISGKKPDAIMYDPYSKKVFAFNGDSENATVIDAATNKEISSVALPGGPEFGVSDGKGKIYNNIEDKSKLVVIDAKALKVTETYPLTPCGTPTGLALDNANHRLFTGCRENKGMSILDANTGKIITTMPIGAGVDAVAYDPETKLIFCSNGDGTTTIIKQESADKYEVVQTLATQVRAKTLALDARTHKIYLSAAKFEEGTRIPLPESFKVLTFKMK